MDHSEKRFNDILNKAPSDFIKAGLLNQPLFRDAHFYIDIFKFKESEVLEFKSSYENFLNHFKKFFDLIKLSKKNSLLSMSYREVNSKKENQLKNYLREADAPFKGAFYLLNFKEIDGFNLGYSKSLHGSSIGLKFKMLLIKSAQELLDLEIDDPEVFCLLPFLQEGIGCDRISDMFISINYLHFLKYTERKLKELRVSEITQITIDHINFNLIRPEKFKNPLILIPKKLVKRLPLSIDWDDIFDTYDENSDLRNKMNKLILSKYNDKKDITKAKVSEMLKENPVFLKQIIQEFKETTSFSQVERKLISEIEGDLDSIDLPQLETLKDQVFFILNKFKWFVERKGIWKLFYQKDKIEGGEKIKHPLSEKHIQCAFYIVAELLAEKFNFEVIRDPDTGTGLVDFKFTNGRTKVLVEIKLSTHQGIVHGFKSQLDEYIESESPEYSYYLVVLLKNSSPDMMKKDIGRVKLLKKAQREAGDQSKKVFLVDGQPKDSASKKRQLNLLSQIPQGVTDILI